MGLKSFAAVNGRRKGREKKGERKRVANENIYDSIKNTHEGKSFHFSLMLFFILQNCKTTFFTQTHVRFVTGCVALS